MHWWCLWMSWSRQQRTLWWSRSHMSYTHQRCHCIVPTVKPYSPGYLCWLDCRCHCIHCRSYVEAPPTWMFCWPVVTVRRIFNQHIYWVCIRTCPIPVYTRTCSAQQCWRYLVLFWYYSLTIVIVILLWQLYYGCYHSGLLVRAVYWIVHEKFW